MTNNCDINDSNNRYYMIRIFLIQSITSKSCPGGILRHDISRKYFKQISYSDYNTRDIEDMNANSTM